MLVTNLDEAVVLVFALMRGDPGIFKAGYTIENAVLAVVDVSEFTADQIWAKLKMDEATK